jgi:hypothetical protein
MVPSHWFHPSVSQESCLLDSCNPKTRYLHKHSLMSSSLVWCRIAADIVKKIRDLEVALRPKYVLDLSPSEIRVRCQYPGEVRSVYQCYQSLIWTQSPNKQLLK